jgi:hypothetical protein
MTALSSFIGHYMTFSAYMQLFFWQFLNLCDEKLSAEHSLQIVNSMLQWVSCSFELHTFYQVA